MELPRNAFKHAIAAGRPQIGLWSSLCSNIVAEIIAGAGFDWIVIDTEHAPNDIGGVLGQLQGLEGGTASPMVRPAWNDPVLVKRILDAGAQGLVFPYVQTADEARAAVAATRYPPDGIRGVAGNHRASRYGRIKDYLRRASEELCIIVQLETGAALAQLEAIATVDGVDGIFIGPSDLSASMGHIGNPGHAAVQAAIKDALERCTRAGTPAGILSYVEDEARRYLDMGFTFVAVGGDSVLLARQSERLAAAFKRDQYTVS